MQKIEWMRSIRIAPCWSDNEWSSYMATHWEGWIRELFEKCGVDIPLLIYVRHPGNDEQDYDMFWGFNGYGLHIKKLVIEIKEPILRDWPKETVLAGIAHEIGHFTYFLKTGQADGRFLREARADRYAEKIIGLEHILDARRRIVDDLIAHNLLAGRDDARACEKLLVILERRLARQRAGHL